ncbi:MAG TPA: TolC family protein [Firmicutes bacterium]|nr:TolC family protein [Bacillota bacterium]
MLKRLQNRGIMILVFLAVFVQAGTVGAKVLEIEVRDAILLAEEHNLDFRLVKIDWQAAQSDLERALIVGEPEMLAEAKKTWAQAEQHYLERKSSLHNSVRTGYQRLLEKETALASVFTAKERAEHQLGVDEKKYEAGLLSSLDIQRAKNSLFEAEQRCALAQIEYETEQMKFNELLGLPFDQEVILTERLLLDFFPFTTDLAECVEQALVHDQAIMAAQEKLQQAKEAVRAAQSPFTPRVELERALAEEEKAAIGLLQAEQALYFRVRAAYYALLNQAHSLELMELQIELERKTLLAEESRYAAGVLSNAQIVKQQEALAQLEQNYSTALLNYSLARLELLRTMGREETAWGGNDGH